MTLPEVVLWSVLNVQDEIRFRRQYPIGPYMLDFYCVEAKVCFEIYGMAPDMVERPGRGSRRDAWLAGQGIAVVRILAVEVLRSPVTVAEAIIARCRT